jgi:hypothetical protein
VPDIPSISSRNCNLAGKKVAWKWILPLQRQLNSSSVNVHYYLPFLKERKDEN